MWDFYQIKRGGIDFSEYSTTNHPCLNPNPIKKVHLTTQVPNVCFKTPMNVWTASYFFNQYMQMLKTGAILEAIIILVSV
jgi:hypothetical protein